MHKQHTAQVQAYLLEIARLCLTINNKTKYAAFYDYSGHAECLYVRVAVDKENHHHKLFNENIYMSLSHAEDSNTEKVLASWIRTLNQKFLPKPKSIKTPDINFINQAKPTKAERNA